MKPGTKRRLKPGPCPHCGKVYTSPAIHVRGCVQNPEVRERTRLALDNGNGTIRRAKEYRDATNKGLAYKTLIAEYGSWDAVAAEFGLRLGPGAYQSRHSVGSKIDALLEIIGAEIDATIAENRALRYKCGAFRM